MSAQLILQPYLPLEDSDTICQWSLHDASGQRMSHGVHSLDEINQVLMQNDLTGVLASVLVPGELLSSFVIQVKQKQAKYLHQTIAFHVEDFIAQDIDDLHIVLGEKLSTEQYRVIAMDKALFEQFMGLINDELSLIKLEGIYSEADALVQNGEDITLFLDETRALIKHRTGVCLTLMPQNLSSYLQTLDAPIESQSDDLADTADDGRDLAVNIFIPQDQSEQYQLTLAEIAQVQSFQIEKETVYMSAFEMLCESFLRQDLSANNLCQGEYQLKSHSSWSLGPWSAVATVAVVWFVLQIGLFVGKGMYFEQQAQEYATQALAEYKKIFPDSRNANEQNLKRIMQGQLNNAGNGASESDFLTLLGEAGYQYSISAGRSNLNFKSISYSRERGELTLEMQAQSFDQLDKLKAALAAQGFEAKISSAVQEKDYFKGRISISAG